MNNFFNKHQVIVIVALTLVIGLMKGGYSFYTERQQKVASTAQVGHLTASLSKRQVPLSEGDVLGAIRLIAILPKKNKTAAGSGGISQLSFGIIAQANAAQFSGKEYNQLVKQAGFKDPTKVNDILVSVVLAGLSMQLDELSPGLAAQIRKLEKMPDGSEITGPARVKIDKTLEPLKRLKKIIDQMSANLKPLPENLKLVRRHRKALMRSLELRS